MQAVYVVVTQESRSLLQLALDVLAVGECLRIRGLESPITTNPYMTRRGHVGVSACERAYARAYLMHLFCMTTCRLCFSFGYFPHARRE